jgi:DNA-directed RNA polymerase specialized sigma24 family protein
MRDSEWLVERFEERRGYLRAVAYRMLGSLSEADDALQDVWVRLSRSHSSNVEHLDAWLTTVVGRVCLNMLRSRERLAFVLRKLVCTGGLGGQPLLLRRRLGSQPLTAASGLGRVQGELRPPAVSAGHSSERAWKRQRQSAGVASPSRPEHERPARSIRLLFPGLRSLAGRRPHSLHLAAVELGWSP